MAKDNKRERILKAAVKVFAQRGFYNSRVSEIARHAGVADGTIYLYFKNKDEILISIFEEEMEKFINHVKKELQSTDNALKKIHKFIRAHFRFVKKHPKLAQVLQLELRQSNKFLKEYTGTKLKEYLNLLASLIEEGQEQGIIRKDIHPSLAKHMLFGAMDELSTHWVLLKGKKYDLEETAGQIADIFIKGICTVY
ncbi:MAG: TetR/AcrR family transcriptional regulator [Calditrichaeota bacterium]|nr:MAG: TetR/AcrR family transcriptional regulator [Calditrichota bacterium]